MNLFYAWSVLAGQHPTYLLASWLVPPSFSRAKTKCPAAVKFDADSFLPIYVNYNLTDISFYMT